MEQVAFAPPPLPPKMRRAPPESTVQNNSGTADVFGYSFPEAQEGNPQVSSSQAGSHVVKIRINPEENASITPSSAASVICEVNPCIRISVNTDEMISGNTMTDYVTERTNPYFYYGAFNCHVMSSGQVSPSDTLDSGTCSDLDSTPPPLPKKKSAGVTVTLIGGQNKKMTGFGGGSGAEGDSDDDSNLSCDSLNSGELQGETNRVEQKLHIKQNNNNKASSFLPQGLLKDIRNRSMKLTQQLPPKIDNEDEPIIEKLNSELNKVVVDESSYHHRKQKERQEKDAAILSTLFFDTDKFYDFHLNEHLSENDEQVKPRKKIDDEYFAGYKDFMGCEDSKTIRSAKGTVRGVKNRVRAGIATFLQINSATRNYKEKDADKVVVYTTTMGIVRETYHACMKVKQILRTLLVKYEERDVFMSGEYQAEIRERMRCDHILVPQVFVDGQHVGDVETIERLNETGELRRLLKPYKSMDVCTTCQTCGGYRLLPCPVCNGSKKSVHRNHFTTEFVALKCMNCDEVGLVKCSAC